MVVGFSLGGRYIGCHIIQSRALIIQILQNDVSSVVQGTVCIGEQ